MSSPVGHRGEDAPAAAAASAVAAAGDGGGGAEAAAAASPVAAAGADAAAAAAAATEAHRGGLGASVEAGAHGRRGRGHRDLRDPWCAWPAYCCSDTRSHH